MPTYNVKYGKEGRCGWVVVASSESEAANKFRAQHDQGKKGEPVTEVIKIAN